MNIYFVQVLISFIFLMTTFSMHNTFYANENACIDPNAGQLEDSVAVAFAHRANLQAATFNILEFKQLEIARIGPYLPQLSLDAQVVKVNRTRVSSIDPKDFVTFTLQQLIWDFGAAFDLFRAAQHDTHIAILTKCLEEDNVRFQTETSVLNLFNVEQQRSSINALDKSSKEQINRASNQLKLGLLNQNEWLESVARYEQSFANVRQYDDSMNIAHSQLERAMGIQIEFMPVEKAIKCNFMTIPTLLSVQCYHDLALANRKELKIKDEEIERERYIKLNQQKFYAPRFSFITQISYDTFRGGPPITPWRTGLAISWDFDGFSSAKTAQATGYRIKKIKMLKCEILDQIKLEVDRAYYTLDGLLKQLQAEQALYFHAYDTFELRKKEFAIGKLSETDFIQAQTNWEVAQFNLISFKIKINMQYRKLLFTTGYPQKLINDWTCT